MLDHQIENRLDRIASVNHNQTRCIRRGSFHRGSSTKFLKVEASRRSERGYFPETVRLHLESTDAFLTICQSREVSGTNNGGLDANSHQAYEGREKRTEEPTGRYPQVVL